MVYSPVSETPFCFLRLCNLILFALHWHLHLNHVMELVADFG
jgi:hypothetical protein